MPSRSNLSATEEHKKDQERTNLGTGLAEKAAVAKEKDTKTKKDRLKEIMKQIGG